MVYFLLSLLLDLIKKPSLVGEHYLDNLSKLLSQILNSPHGELNCIVKIVNSKIAQSCLEQSNNLVESHVGFALQELVNFMEVIHHLNICINNLQLGKSGSILLLKDHELIILEP
jgi:hypothetical protein